MRYLAALTIMLGIALWLALAATAAISLAESYGALQWDWSTPLRPIALMYESVRALIVGGVLERVGFEAAWIVDLALLAILFEIALWLMPLAAGVAGRAPEISMSARATIGATFIIVFLAADFGLSRLL